MERLYSLLHLLLESHPLLLSIALVTMGVLFGSYYRFKISTSQAKRLPPGSLGLPFFGETIGFLRAQRHDKTQEWFESRSKKYGPIFKTSLIGKPTIVITGPAGNRFLFNANENTIASNPVSTVTAIMGRYNIFELSGNEHKLIRGAMASFLKPENMDKNIFPEPEKFEPSRFQASSKSYPPYSYIPFGAGPRICPGSEFARIEILLVMHHLVTNYEWSELVPNEPITRDPMPYPAMGLPIKQINSILKRREDLCLPSSKSSLLLFFAGLIYLCRIFSSGER